MRIDYRWSKYHWWVLIRSLTLVSLGIVLLAMGIKYGLFPLVIGGFILRHKSFPKRF